MSLLGREDHAAIRAYHEGHLRALAALQDKHCDMSRGTRKGARILRNVGRAARFFPIDEPVLCVGSGDGLEVEAWRLLGYEAFGLDISPRKCSIAREYGVPATEAPAEDLDVVEGRFNIYCAHTLEHCSDPEIVLASFEDKAISTICIIVPLEPAGTKNPSHLHPVIDLAKIRLNGFEEVARFEHFNDEPEGWIVWKKRSES